MKYILSTYITNYRQRFVNCYTRKVLHFGTTTTSRGEGGHAAVKRQIGSSTGDLKIVVDGLALMLMNEYQNYLIKINQAKINLAMEHRKPIFRNIIGHVTPTALKKIAPEYAKLTGQPTALLPCKGEFTTSTGLPCSHKMQERLFAGEGILLNDVHSH